MNTFNNLLSCGSLVMQYTGAIWSCIHTMKYWNMSHDTNILTADWSFLELPEIYLYLNRRVWLTYTVGFYINFVSWYIKTRIKLKLQVNRRLCKRSIAHKPTFFKYVFSRLNNIIIILGLIFLRFLGSLKLFSNNQIYKNSF